jgi:hypothetical protein
LVSLGVVLGVRAALFQQFEAVVGRLVADQGAVADGLNVLIMLLVLVFLLGTGDAPAHGDQTGSPGSQDTQ